MADEDSHKVNSQPSSREMEESKDDSPLSLLKHWDAAMQRCWEEMRKTSRSLINRLESLQEKKARFSALKSCIKDGDVQGVREKVRGDLGVDVTDMKGCTTLYFAVKYGQEDIVEWLLQEGATAVAGPKDRTPISHCVRYNQPGSLRLLLQASVDCTSVLGECRKERTIWTAAAKGHLKVLKVLVQHADVSVTEKLSGNYTPIHVAAKSGHAHVVEWLLQQQVPVDLEGPEGRTPLFIAAQSNQPSVIETLAQHGANLETSWNGETALLVTMLYGFDASTAALVRSGAKGNEVADSSMGLLHSLAASGTVEAIEACISRGMNVRQLEESPSGAGLVPPLFEAVRNNNGAVIEVLIEKFKVGITKITPQGDSLLHVAARYSNVDTFKLCLKLAPSLVDSTNANDETPLATLLAVNLNDTTSLEGDGRKLSDGEAEKAVALISAGFYSCGLCPNKLTYLEAAVELQSVSVVQKLLRSGASPNYRAVKGQEKIVERAVRRGNPEIIDSLLAYRAKVYATNQDLVSMAVTRAHRKVITVLASHGLRVNHIGNSGMNACHLAASRGHASIVEEALASGCAVNKRDDNGWTAIMLGARYPKVVQLLIKAGADVNGSGTPNPAHQCHRPVVRRDDPQGPLSCAVQFANEEGALRSIQLLLTAGARANGLLQHSLRSPLYFAVNAASKIKTLKGIEALLAAGADVNRGNSAALKAAVATDNMDAVKLLLSRGARPTSALLVAVRHRSVPMVKVLVEAGADVNENGEIRALLCAIASQQMDIIEILLSRGAKPNVGTRSSALCGAIETKNRAIIERMLEAGSDVNDGGNGEALRTATRLCERELVDLLLSRGADANAVPNSKTPPILAVSIEKQDLPTLESLIKAGANANALSHEKGAGGRVMLHLAARYGDPHLIAALCEAGADVNAADTDGTTPLHVAANCMHYAAVEALLKHGADPLFVNKDGNSILHGFVGNARLHDLRQWLDCGLKDFINSTDKNNRTPLWYLMEHIRVRKDSQYPDSEEALNPADSSLFTEEALDTSLDSSGNFSEEDCKHAGDDRSAMAAENKPDDHPAKRQRVNGAASRCFEVAACERATVTDDPPVVQRLKLLLEFGADPMTSGGLRRAVQLGQNDAIEIMLNSIRCAGSEKCENCELGREGILRNGPPIGHEEESNVPNGSNDLPSSTEDSASSNGRPEQQKSPPSQLCRRFKGAVRYAWETSFNSGAKPLSLLRRKFLHALDVPVDGPSLVHRAMLKGPEFVTEVLELPGMHVNIADEAGRTPLMMASSKSADVVDLLLSRNPNLERRDKNGSTALHYAVKRSNRYMATVLLNHGANPRAENFKGQTPVGIAKGLWAYRFQWKHIFET